MAPMQRCYW